MAGNPDPADYGWTLMEVTQRKAMYYRWRNGVRQELCMLYDKKGNLETWSLWENTRINIDGDTGRRHRLNKYLSLSQEDALALGGSEQRR